MSRWFLVFARLTLALLVSLTPLGQFCLADDLPKALVDAQEKRVKTIAQASLTAVGVFGPGGAGGGSGVVISPDGYALTNYHVVQSCDPFMKCSMADGVLYDAVIVGIDPTGDVALIKLLGRDDFPFAPLGDSDALEAGQWCFAVGNPFLLATNFEPTVSWGIVSGVHRYQYPAGTILEYADCIQTDAAINPGNSGGPLFNGDGELIGINGRGSFEKRGRVNVGVGYAISINQIKNFMGHLKSGRIVDHSTIGATVATDDQGKVRVSNILESSQAFRRGLEYDDEVVRFAGRNIQTVNQFKNVLGIYPKGWRVPITFVQDGIEKEISIRMSGVHATETLVQIVEGQPINRPQAPTPQASGDDAKPKTFPPQYRHLYRQRSGFANYYFNEQNQNRIWKRFSERGDFTTQPFSWRLTCVDQDDQTITFVLGDKKSGIKMGDNAIVLDPNEDFSVQLEPAGSGGLLVALHMWRLLLVSGPEKFGDVYHLGTVPNRFSDGNSELLVGTRDAIENHFLFNQTDGRLSSLEMHPDPNVDPCEVYFENYQVDRDLEVPSTIRYTIGNEVPRQIRIRKIEFLEEPHNASRPSSP